MGMILVVVLAADPLSAHRIVFSHYESREPTAEQNLAYERRDKRRLISSMPVAHRVEMRIRDGESKSFASGKLKGTVALAEDGQSYALKFDTGRFRASTTVLVRRCEPLVFYTMRTKVGGQSRISAQSVLIGEGC